MKKRVVGVAAVFAAVGAVGPAWAQVPGSVLPGQIERSQQAPREPVRSMDPVQVSPGAVSAPSGAASVRFALKAVSVEGARALPAARLSEGIVPAAGKEVSLADVYAWAEAMTARYRAEGYILSQVVVPAQTIRDGVVVLQAVEGYIDKVVVKGSAAAAALVASMARAIEQMRPLTAEGLERQLLLLNDLPGVSARSTISPSSLPGAAQLEVEVSQRATAFSAGLGNRNSKALGPWRLGLEGDWMGLSGPDRLGVRATASTEGRELMLGSLTYDRVLDDRGLKLGLGATTLRSRPAATAASPALDSRSTSASLALAYPLVRTRLQNVHLRAGLSAQQADTDTAGAALFQDRVRALRLGINVDLVDAWRGINLLDVELSQGLKGTTGDGDPLASRVGTRSQFSKTVLYAARLQSLAPGWSVLAAATLQHSGDPLLASEQLGFGGAEFGRGYDAAELSGDRGTAAKIELRYSATGLMPLSEYTVYAFADAGRVRSAASGAGPTQRADAAGAGLRFQAIGGVSGFIEAARPRQSLATTVGGKTRWFTGLSASF